MTKDQDLKALIRERMARTGESYTTARSHFLQPDAAAPQAVPGRFAMSRDEPAQRVIDRTTQSLVSEAVAELTPDALRVRVGDPAMWDIRIPRHSIVAARRVPDRPAGTSLGAHGSRGRWLVNTAYSGLVELRIEPPVAAQLRVQSALPEDVARRTPRWLRPLLRDRSPKVRRLTINVDDPDAFLHELDRPSSSGQAQ